LQRRLSAKGDEGSRIRSAWSAGLDRTFEVFADLISAVRLLGPAEYLDLLQGLSERLERFEGQDFSVTPLADGSALSDFLGRTGQLWIKNETDNIAGSHKGRHLMATLLYLEALRALDGRSAKKILSIYSCGNAALAASAVARAGDYELHAFVPGDVDPLVAVLLAERGAFVEKVSRNATGAGDPCYLAFQEALSRCGWLPFACAGTDNWSNIEGGSTLGWELIMQLADRTERVDSVVVQVGGGALARAVAQAFEEAFQLGLIGALPRLHVCQPEGGFPFVRAFYLVLAEIARKNGLSLELNYDRSAAAPNELSKLKEFSWTRGDQVSRTVEFVQRNFDTPAVQSVLYTLSKHRGRYMWDWDGPAPHSYAHGILDDFTHDWYHLLQAMLRTGGRAEILKEDTIRTAHGIAQSRTGIPVCPTGASGLAGLIQLQESGAVDRGESVGLFFTGFDRTKIG
jgi:threonine synthase